MCVIYEALVDRPILLASVLYEEQCGPKISIINYR